MNLISEKLGGILEKLPEMMAAAKGEDNQV
jgi:hypothetical protein